MSDPLDDARMLERDDRRAEPGTWRARSDVAVVATAHYRATAAAREVLEAGGDVVDAAVAGSLALAVCEPAGSGLGGMAIALVHRADEGRTMVVEGPCRAPALATPAAVAGAPSRYRGHAAVAVPAHPKVLAHLHRRWGRLPLERVLAPAIALAEEGFRLTPLQHRLFGQYANTVRPGSAPALYHQGGAPRAAGERVVQPALARTLRRLATAGFEDAYQGELARALDADMRAHGGFVRLADLTGMPAPRESEPVRWSAGGRTLLTAGPPAGGWILARMWALAHALEPLPDPADPAGLVRVARIVRRARRDRIRLRKKVGMLALEGAARLFEPERVRAAARKLDGEEDARGETTHLSILDAAGNAVALTQSIERSFGAGVVAGELGYFLNGYLRAFKLVARHHPHYLRPGAVARSNAAPTVVLDGDGRPAVVVGSTGSERMVSGILTVLLHLEHGAEAYAASAAPRLHATPEGQVLVEARLGAAQRAALEAAGFGLVELEPWDFKVGGLNLAVREGAWLVGVGEPRRDGAAAGPRR